TDSHPPVCAASKPVRRWSASRRVRHPAADLQGARACPSDGVRARHVLAWAPRVALSEGSVRIDAGIGDQLAEYDAGIFGRLAADGRGREPVVRAPEGW